MDTDETVPSLIYQAANEGDQTTNGFTVHKRLWRSERLLERLNEVQFLWRVTGLS